MEKKGEGRREGKVGGGENGAVVKVKLEYDARDKFVGMEEGNCVIGIEIKKIKHR